MWKSSRVVNMMTGDLNYRLTLALFFHLWLINSEIIIPHFSVSVGYFVQPTIVQTKNPTHKIMTEEIFGPVLTVYVYKDNAVEDILRLIETSTPYALTGAVFAQDE